MICRSRVTATLIKDQIIFSTSSGYKDNSQQMLELLSATEVHIGSHWALLGEVAGRMDTSQQNSGQLSATEVHIWSHWALLGEV